MNTHWINNIYFVLVLFSLFFLVYIINMVRHNKLHEKYSLFWILVTIIIVLGSIFRPLLDIVAKALDVSYPPSLLYLAGFIFVIFYFTHLTATICKLNDNVKKLAQEIAILKKDQNNQE